MRAPSSLLAAVACASSVACSGDTALPIDENCNPLGIEACMTPWPSSAFEIDDVTTATGRRLLLDDTADGFSPAAAMVMVFPDDVSSGSLATPNATVILDMRTGELVAHVAEIDANVEGSADAHAVILRPAAHLIAGHRYAVAITTRVVAADGDDLPVPPGFAAVRDGRHTDHMLLEAMRPRFGEVLDALDGAGFPEDDLVVAWDFTVASDPALTADRARR